MVVEWTLAIRYLKSPHRGFASLIAIFSFLGILLGVATLIIVTSVMNGFQSELLGKLMGMKGHLLVYPHEHPLMSSDLPKLSHPNIQATVPLIEKQAIIMCHGQTKGMMIQGIMGGNMQALPIFNQYTPSQLFLKEHDILVGQAFLDAMCLKENDTIQMMIPYGRQTPLGNFPKIVTLKIHGTFNVKMRDFDKNFIFMNAHTMQQLYNMGEHMSHMEIFLKNPFKSTSTLKELTRLLDGYTVIDWKHGDQAIFQAVKIEKNVMFIILTLIVVIAAFNIISTMMMMVKDKYKSIGILKTIGASPSMILRLFMICGSIIGISGTVLGAIVGIFLTRHLEHVRQILQKVFGVNLFHPDIYFLSELPVKILPFDIGLIVSIAFILTLVASFYPAYQASRLSPIEIFKN